MTRDYRATKQLATLIVTSVVIALLLVSDAFAVQGRVLERTFGSSTSTTIDPYPLSNTNTCSETTNACQKRVAVDATTARPSSGDIYVTDPNNRRVEKFDSSGNFILMFGKNVNKTKVEEVGATEAERNVCTAVSGNTCQAGTEGTGPGAFVGKTLAVAVDSSTGPSAGDVYVANTTKYPINTSKGEGAGEGIVTKFDENGKVIAAWGVSGQMLGSGRPFGAFGGIATDLSGDLWIYGTAEEEELGSKTVHFRARPLVFELDQTGTLVTSWQPSRKGIETTLNGIALDGEHHVYLGVDQGDIAKFAANDGTLLSLAVQSETQNITSDFTAHTVDFVKRLPGGSLGIASIETTCQPLLELERCPTVESFSTSRPHEWGSLAVNYSLPNDAIYVSEEAREVAAEVRATVPTVTTLPAAPVSTTAATLNGTVNPEGVEIEECFFEWGEGAGAYEHDALCNETKFEGTSPKSVKATITIQAGKSYHFRLVAANAHDKPEPVMGADTLLGPPLVDASSVTQVTATTATLTSQLNPRNLATRYHFEYLSEAAFEANGESFTGPEHAISSPLVAAELTAGQKDVAVSTHVTGLQPHTSYRYRVIAENLLGEGGQASTGTAETFVTWNTGEFSLPDGRGWEMVSPPDKRGALVEPIGEDWIIQAAASGGRLAYVTRAPSESNPAGYLIYQSSLATRTSEGWSSRDLALPHTSASEISVGEGWEYRLFSEDLSSAVIQPFGPFVSCQSELGAAQPCLSPQGTEQTAFLASDYKEGSSTEPCRESCYTPLVTGAEGVSNVPAETVFGQTSWLGKTCFPSTFCGPRFLDATPDLSHVLLMSRAALTASSAPKSSVPPDSLYEWSAGAPPSEQLHLVSVLPGEGASHEAPPGQSPQIGFYEGNARNSISADGSRVVFCTHCEVEPERHLYLRENVNQPQSPIGSKGECLVAADACTIQLDAGLSGVPQFQTANSAVTRIFFTDGPGDGLSVGNDLYEYNLEKHELVRMTTGASVPGSVIGASEDGSQIYFVGNGALAPHAVTGRCNTSGTVGCNLYSMRYDGTHWEAPTLIAVLAHDDFTDWAGDGPGYPGLAARVSPNGQWLAFMSRRRLTGYDNEDAVSGEPDAEVYEYAAATGSLVCASCSPTGARPHGKPATQIDTGNGGVAGGHLVFKGWIAASLPGWTPSLTASVSVYQSRFLSDSGRLFFNSADALVSKDTNSTEDVYEYEPEGIPSGEHACSPSAETGGVTFRQARSLQVEGVEVHEGAGCVGLISSGESANESGFLDASETGSEVFFVTTARLSKQDTDSSYDVYDARECSSGSPCLAEPATPLQPCSEEASCKPPPGPSPSIFGPSGSAIFSGPGNFVQPLAAPASKPKALTKAQLLARALKSCRNDKSRKKRTACEKQARKRYGSKKAPGKKASTTRQSAQAGGKNR